MDVRHVFLQISTLPYHVNNDKLGYVLFRLFFLNVLYYPMLISLHIRFQQFTTKFGWC